MLVQVCARVGACEMASNGDTTPTSPNKSNRSPPLLRRGIPGERKPLKEKLLTYYERIFKASSDPLDGSTQHCSSRTIYSSYCAPSDIQLDCVFRPLGRGPVPREPPLLGGVLSAESKYLSMHCGS